MTDDEKPLETVEENALQNADTESTESNKKEEVDDNNEVLETKPPRKPNSFKRFLGFYKTKKKIAIPLTVLGLVIVILAVPLTRFALLGTVIKSSFVIGVNDDRNYVEVSGAKVTIDGQTVVADSSGRAKFTNIKPGKRKVHVEKKYYKSGDVTINVAFGYNKYFDYVHITALGRFVPVTINNKITGKPVADAQIKVADTDSKTDKDGKATIVVPAEKSSLDATISLDGYNDAKVKLDVTAFETPKNVFSLVPSGKIYFLSKFSGRIDVVKTDLDGSNRQTVLPGTGQEEDTNTVLLASRDWKYLVLQSRRDSEKSKLYLIDTSKDKLTEMDSGDATFTAVGWRDHYFIYKVSRDNALVWQSKAAALKTFNAETLQLNVLDETSAEGSGDSDYVTDAIDNVYILKDSVVYTKHWYAGYYSIYRLAGKRMGIYSIKLAGTGKQTIKDFDAGNNGYINAILSKPTEIYFSVNSGTVSYYEYQDGTIKETKELSNESFYKPYPTYLASPGGQNTFWYESRDGKNTLLVGTQDGSNPKEVASLSEYIPYGWYSDNYLLVSKGGSELFVMPASGAGDKGQILKVADYHKPNVSFQGYGYGYGGF